MLSLRHRLLLSPVCFLCCSPLPPGSAGLRGVVPAVSGCCRRGGMLATVSPVAVVVVAAAVVVMASPGRSGSSLCCAAVVLPPAVGVWGGLVRLLDQVGLGRLARLHAQRRLLLVHGCLRNGSELYAARITSRSLASTRLKATAAERRRNKHKHRHESLYYRSQH